MARMRRMLLAAACARAHRVGRRRHARWARNPATATCGATCVHARSHLLDDEVQPPHLALVPGQAFGAVARRGGRVVVEGPRAQDADARRLRCARARKRQGTWWLRHAPRSAPGRWESAPCSWQRVRPRGPGRWAPSRSAPGRSHVDTTTVPETVVPAAPSTARTWQPRNTLVPPRTLAPGRWLPQSRTAGRRRAAARPGAAQTPERLQGGGAGPRCATIAASRAVLTPSRAERPPSRVERPPRRARARLTGRSTAALDLPAPPVHAAAHSSASSAAAAPGAAPRISSCSTKRSWGAVEQEDGACALLPLCTQRASVLSSTSPIKPSFPCRGSRTHALDQHLGTQRAHADN